MSDRFDDARDQLKAAKAAESRAAGMVKSAAPDDAERSEKPSRPLLSVTDARANLAAALAELDEAMSIKGSMRRHPGLWAVAGGLAVLGVAGAIVWALRKK